jgi:hypothetical protein
MQKAEFCIPRIGRSGIVILTLPDPSRHVSSSNVDDSKKIFSAEAALRH